MEVCGECVHWSPNMTGSYVSNLCHKDMFDDDCAFWFVKREAMHECHRNGDFEQIGKGGFGENE